MVLELLFLCLLIIGLCVVAYRGAIHEFQILQKDYHPDNDWSEMLSEQLPVVIRGLPKHWLGGWTAAKTGQKTWTVTVHDDTGRKFRTTWNHWLQTPAPRPKPTAESMEDIADAIRLQHTIENWTLEDCRRWSWIPPTLCPKPYVLEQTLGLEKTVAEFTAIVSTDGAPLELWIAHEGAISAKVAAQLAHKDPWIQTSEEIPWINTVKYIEIRLRPGNAVLLPRHWWYAIRPAAAESTAWFWRGEFHTPISRVAAALAPQKFDS